MDVRGWNVGNFIVGTNSREVVIKFIIIYRYYSPLEGTSSQISQTHKPLEGTRSQTSQTHRLYTYLAAVQHSSHVETVACDVTSVVTEVGV